MLTLGKLRGLAAISSSNGTFSMLALDHRGSFRRMTADMFGGEATWEQVVAEKVRLAGALLPHATAVLTDPLFTAGPLVARGVLPGNTGFLVALEQSGFTDEPGGRRNVIEPGWTVEAIKRMGAAGVKLLVQYHPAAENASLQEDFVAKIGEECRQHDLVLVVEPVCYAPKGKKSDRAFIEAMPALIPEIARRFDDSGADILKLEYPLLEEAAPADMEAACAGITAATRLPWVVLSGGVPFDDFLAQVRAACAAGASGYLGGRAIWKEAMTMADPLARDAFLSRVAAPRIAALTAVTEASATPWQDRPSAKNIAAVQEGWHRDYAAGQ